MQNPEQTRGVVHPPWVHADASRTRNQCRRGLAIPHVVILLARARLEKALEFYGNVQYSSYLKYLVVNGPSL